MKKRRQSQTVLGGLVPMNETTLKYFHNKPKPSKENKQSKKHSEVKSISKHEDLPIKPRGLPKSGRFWKTEKTKFSGMVKVKTLHSTWEKKVLDRKKKQGMKKLEKQMKDNRAAEIQEKKRRRAEKIKRREENERRGEVVVPIKNTAKLKRMKKKQLRKIQKR